MATFELFPDAVDNLLHGPAGPVFRHVEEFTQGTAAAAKFFVPVDTGQLQDSIHAERPTKSATGLEADVVSAAVNPRTGRDYSRVVHQGHGGISPLTAPQLRFFWKKRGIAYRTIYVNPYPGHPYLFAGMRVANGKLFGGRFTLTQDLHDFII